MSDNPYTIDPETIERLRRERDEETGDDRSTGYDHGWSWADDAHFTVLRDFADEQNRRPDYSLPHDEEVPEEIGDPDAYIEGVVDAVIGFWNEAIERLAWSSVLVEALYTLVDFRADHHPHDISLCFAESAADGVQQAPADVEEAVRVAWAFFEERYSGDSGDWGVVNELTRELHSRLRRPRLRRPKPGGPDGVPGPDHRARRKVAK